MDILRHLGSLADRFIPPRPVDAPLRSLADLGTAAAAELEHNILPFWLTHARNSETSGFWGEVRSNLRGRRSRLRGAMLTSRILWAFSAAYRRFRAEPMWLEMATYARDDLLRTFLDRDHGGLVWAAAPDGTTRDARKRVYGQSFGIYGLAEYHRATGDPVALEEAIALYRLIEEHARDPVHGGYFDAFSADWAMVEAPASGAVKSMDTMLHLTEAYANLYRAWPDPSLRGDLREMIETILDRMVDKAGTSLIQLVRDDWSPVSEHRSYGHDLEFCWLAVDAAQNVGDAALIDRTRNLAVAVARHAAASADEDGGLVNETRPDRGVDPIRQWWVQAEAAVAFLDAYEISGEDELLHAAQRIWALIESRYVDHRHGEWFAATTRDGRPLRHHPKIAFWKCPYHNGRACMELAERAARLSSAGR